MESELQNWDFAQECFEDNKRNSLVLQAYAIMEGRETYIEAQSTINNQFFRKLVMKRKKGNKLC
eukprot:1698613-Ditylum_brightwellii.AAC.1